MMLLRAALRTGAVRPFVNVPSTFARAPRDSKPLSSASNKRPLSTTQIPTQPLRHSVAFTPFDLARSIPCVHRHFTISSAYRITDPKTGRGDTRGPSGSGSGATKQDATSQKGNFDVNQPEFESTASSQPGKDPEVEKAANYEDLPSEESDKPRQPLPDLRHGIPSTFEQEFSPEQYKSSDGEGASFKDKDAPEPTLNVTEDPTKEDAREEPGAGELPKQAYVSSIDRRRNRTANIAFLLALFGGVAGFVYMGQEWTSEEEAKKYPDAPNGWAPGAIYARATSRLSSDLGYYTEPVSTQILPDVPLDQRPPYTLVMSLEDLLITSKWSRQNGWEVAKRPGFDYFIRYLHSYYEIVVFTTVPSMNGQMVLAKLDPYHLIMWPLFREHTRYMNGEHVKDLSCLNRDLSKTIIVDTRDEHVKLQPENAIVLPKWNGQPKDPHSGDLVSLIPFLEYIATQPNVDVRKVLKSYEGKHIPSEFARREKQIRAEMEARAQRSGKRAGGLTSALGFGGQAGGLTVQDRVREQGRLAYESLEKQIREEGASWLEQEAEMQKKQMEEITKTVQGNPLAYFSIMFGGAPPGEQKPDKDDKN